MIEGYTLQGVSPSMICFVYFLAILKDVQRFEEHDLDRVDGLNRVVAYPSKW